MLKSCRRFFVKNNDVLEPLILRKFSENARRDVLRRIQVVQETKECSRITEKILSENKVIAVDLEATLGPPGLVQFGTRYDDIFLFRTGINRDLFKSGGLKAVFEHPEITKIFHDASGDNLSLAKADIRLNSLFDTNIAYCLLLHQSKGKPLYGNSISFNNLCQEFNLEVNPFKSKFKGMKWMFHEKSFFIDKPLDEDLQIYCAYDVKPLIQLYEILNERLEPDYQPIFDDMHKVVLERPFDESLAKELLKKLRSIDKQSVFISSLEESTNKSQISQVLTQFTETEMDVKMAPRYNASNVTFDIRQTALNAYNHFGQDGALTKLGKNCKLELIRHEIPSPKSSGEETKTEVSNHEKVDVEVAAPEIARKLIRAKCPVFVQFSTNQDSNFPDIEIYAGQETKLKFNLSDKSLVKSYGPLISSLSVVKILKRSDVTESRQGLKIFHDEGFKAENMFDLDLAVKLCNFMFHGISFTSSSSSSTKSHCEHYAIKTESKLKDALNLHLHLSQIMPEQVQPLFKSLIQIGAELDASEDKKSLAVKYQESNLHLKLDKSDRVKNVEEILKNNGISHQINFQVDDILILKITDSKNFDKAREILEKKLQKRCQIRKIGLHSNTEVGTAELCDETVLENLRQMNRKRLSNLFEFLGETENKDT